MSSSNNVMKGSTVRPKGLAWTLARTIDLLCDISGALCGSILILSALFVVLQVVMRRVLHMPTDWVPDLTTYILIWVGFLSAGYGLKEGSHVVVDSLVEHLKPRVRGALEILSYAVVAIYAALFTVYAYQMAATSFRMHEVAFTAWRVIIWPVKLGVPIGMGLLTLQAVSMFIKSWRAFSEMKARGEEACTGSCIFAIAAFVALMCLGAWCFIDYPLWGTLILLSVLLAAAIPIGFSLGVIGCIGLVMLFHSDQGLINMPVMGFGQLNSFTLVALPLFMIAGSLAKAGRLADKLFNVAAAFVGHWPGGLGVATIVACAIFAAMAGSSVACAATVGTVALPLLMKRGYSGRFACGIVAGGGTLGILLPPGTNMIIYSVLTEESLGRLFMAGILPGIVLAILFSIYIMWSCRSSKEYVREPWIPWPEKFKIVKSSLVGLAMPVLVLGLIYTGTVYVTEAAGIAVLYVLIACLIEGTIKWRDLITILKESAQMTTMLFMMIIGSVVLGGMVSVLGFTEKIVESVVGMHLSAGMVVFLLMVLLIVLGTYLEPSAIMFLFVPIAAPLLKSLHVDLVWFGVLFAINMEMAIISPPVGTNMNVVQQISGVSYTEVNKGVIPFIFVMAVGLIIMGFFPQLSLWLPNLLMK